LEGSWQTADHGFWDVIDAGCGSGILAISAVRLGARSVLGFDCDATAVRVSRTNSALNGVSGQTKFLKAGLRTGLGGRRARLVLANIQTDVLIRHRRELAAAVLPGGWLSLSGILARELAQVRAAFAFVGPTWKVASRRIGEWADLLLTRPAGPGYSA
jgi:ribosomal protein L11 methyltransferase